MMTAGQPTLFISHGSPLPISGADGRDRIWSALASRLQKPAAVLVVSSNWCTRLPVLSGSYCPSTASGHKSLPGSSPVDSVLARCVKQTLKDAGIAAGIDAGRRLESDAVDVMRRLVPQPDVPLLQLSIQPDRCARHHHALGLAIALLRHENILIVGLGRMTPSPVDCEHAADDPPAPRIGAFRDWAHSRLVSGTREQLFDWQRAAPGPVRPRPEHFLPLFVTLGAAGAGARAEWLGGGGGDRFGEAPAADNYLFGSS
jgi:4,5-DOPA dioxygenase extradiol